MQHVRPVQEGALVWSEGQALRSDGPWANDDDAAGAGPNSYVAGAEHRPSIHTGGSVRSGDATSATIEWAARAAAGTGARDRPSAPAAAAANAACLVLRALGGGDALRCLEGDQGAWSEPDHIPEIRRLDFLHNH